MLEVNPISDSFSEVIPFLQVFENAFAAFGIELLDAVSFDLCLTGEAQLLFHLKFDGKPVSVPTGDARRVITLHHLIAGDNIFISPGQDMMNTGIAVSRWGSLIKDKTWFAFTILDAFFKNMVLLPEFQMFFFVLREIYPVIDRYKHGNPPCIEFQIPSTKSLLNKLKY